MPLASVNVSTCGMRTGVSGGTSGRPAFAPEARGEQEDQSQPPSHCVPPFGATVKATVRLLLTKYCEPLAGGQRP